MRRHKPGGLLSVVKATAPPEDPGLPGREKFRKTSTPGERDQNTLAVHGKCAVQLYAGHTPMFH